MIIVGIPGREPLRIDHVILDYNGIVAVDELLLKGAVERISRLREHVKVHVLTADTYGAVARQCEPLGVEVRTFPREDAVDCKEETVRGLEDGVACLGNGFNDTQMFDAARLSVVVLEREGMCAALLGHAVVVARSIEGRLDLLLKPDRLRATLRSWCLRKLHGKDCLDKNGHAGLWKCGFT